MIFKKAIFYFIALFLVYLFACGLRIYLYLEHPNLKSGGEDCFFYSESAVHYYYTKIIATGREVPVLDKRIEFPSGLEPAKRFTMGMERLVGGAYKVLSAIFFKKGFSLFKFVIFMICISSSLSIFPLAGSIRLLSEWEFPAIIGALLFAVSPLTFMRSLGHYIREDFTFPLLFGFIYYLLRLSIKVSLANCLFYGFLLFLSLGMWHLSQFFFWIIVLFLFLNLFLSHWAKFFAPGILSFPFLLAGGFYFKAIRSANFLKSPLIFFSFLTMAGYIIALAINRKKLVSSLIITLAVIIGFFYLYYFKEENKDYAHVYSLIAGKLMHFGVKPDDPGQLSYEARVFWQSGYLSPDFKEVKRYLLPLLAFAVFALFLILSSSSIKPHHKGLVLYLFLSTAFSYLMFKRLRIAFIYMIVLIILLASGELKRKYAKVAFYSSIFLLAGNNFYTSLNIYRHIEVIENEPIQNLIDFIRNSTNKDSPFLAPFSLSPSILCYAQRPIILHSMFENAAIRRKVLEYFEALYSDEESFYRYCQRVRADYVIFRNTDLFKTDKESTRYIADKMKLKKDSLPVIFCFYPEKLTHFHLIRQDWMHQIYRVLKYGELKPQTVLPSVEYQPTFDRRLYGIEQMGEYLDDKKINEVYNLQLKALKYYNKGVNSMKEEDFLRASEFFIACKNIEPNYLSAYNNLAVCYLHLNKPKEAKEEIVKGLQIDPQDIMLHYNLAGIFIQSKDFPRAVEELEFVVSRDPNDLESQLRLLALYFQVNDNEKEQQKLAQLSPTIKANKNSVLKFLKDSGLMSEELEKLLKEL